MNNFTLTNYITKKPLDRPLRSGDVILPPASWPDWDVLVLTTVRDPNGSGSRPGLLFVQCKSVAVSANQNNPYLNENTLEDTVNKCIRFFADSLYVRSILQDNARRQNSTWSALSQHLVREDDTVLLMLSTGSEHSLSSKIVESVLSRCNTSISIAYGALPQVKDFFGSTFENLPAIRGRFERMG